MKQHNIFVRELLPDNRLDKTIAYLQSEISRTAAKKLIEQGAVYINRKRCKVASRTLKIGDKIQIYIKEAGTNYELPSLQLAESQIVYEDRDLILVNKPYGIPTHSTLDDTRNNLVLSLQKYLGEKSGVDFKTIYIGVHHRLDRDTSGLILFTKQKSANKEISEAFQSRSIHKKYLAICLGQVKEKEFVIKSFLGAHPKDKQKFASVMRDGKFAETKVKVIGIGNWNGRPISYILAEPTTGRTHQIRVHLSENNLPILGDILYAPRVPGENRLFLHAWRLSLGERQWEAPLPDEFRSLAFPALE